jgi:hypothetical protein
MSAKVTWAEYLKRVGALEGHQNMYAVRALVVVCGKMPGTG